jgi:hypothetical protein
MARDAQIEADDLCWTLPVVLRAEDVEILVLTESELFVHAQVLQEELRAVRAVLSEGLRQLASERALLKAARSTIRRLQAAAERKPQPRKRGDA